MANHKSAIERIHQNRRKRARNRAARSKLKTDVKRFRSLVAEKNTDQAKKSLPETVSLIDKTLQKGIIHENKAARLKSRLSRLVNALKA